MPTTIGLVIIAFAASLSIILMDIAIPDLGIATITKNTFLKIDFHDVVMEGALSFLLFAGALHVDLNSLIKRRYTILSLATIGVLISTIIIGIGIYFIGQLIGLKISWPYAFVFGALISPTDPVAVMGLLKSMKNVPESFRVKIAGESLFNDGVGIVLFTIIVSIAVSSNDYTSQTIDFVKIIKLFTLEVVGGILLGFVTGYIAFKAIKSINDFSLEILITLSLVMVTYGLAVKFHLSGPLAVVVAGLFIGNFGTKLAMSKETKDHVNNFWLIIDEILNAGLFLLIGLEVIALTFTITNITAAILAIPLVLFARLISVSIPITFLKMRRDFEKGVIPVLTWGGMKGAISVALALSLPDIEIREHILIMTYAVVIFSIVIQGLTMKSLVNKIIIK
tara:strand:- start:623 stop:1804 length:1182 start_codon:yes stop_codon:yes gene_type:complete